MCPEIGGLNRVRDERLRLMSREPIQTASLDTKVRPYFLASFFSLGCPVAIVGRLDRIAHPDGSDVG